MMTSTQLGHFQAVNAKADWGVDTNLPINFVHQKQFENATSQCQMMEVYYFWPRVLVRVIVWDHVRIFI